MFVVSQVSPHSKACLCCTKTLRASRSLRLRLLGRPAKTVVARVKDNQRRLEGNVAKDVLAKLTAALDAAEAGRAALLGGRVVDDAAGDGDGGPAHAEAKVGQRGGAVEDVAAHLLVVLGTLDLGVVVLDDAVVDEEQRGARVGDALDLRGLQVAVAHGVSGGSEAPEAAAAVDLGVGNLPVVLLLVNVAKVVGAV